ncbi:MAG: MotA/TolQ/ExbB proton channel family protein [Pseudomonadota bacterium]|nr:MotA/TolQ/ExbB proton channel family protein [Pseudomonadota bacterium]
MHSFDVIVNFFKQGGFFLYPIALIWVIGLVIAVERFVYLTKIGGGNKRLWDDLQPLFEAGNFKQALQSVSTAEDGALAQVMRYGMSRVESARRRDDIEKAMEESLIEVIPHLERRTHYLAALANIGMLMGLFGTVLGLINAFAAVAQANPAEKASLLSASISVAMNNTALGLLVAITLLLSHLYLETKTTNIVDSLEVATVKFLNSLSERQIGAAAGEVRGAKA